MRLEITVDQVAENEESLAWYRRELESLRKSIRKYLCLVCFTLICLIMIAFALPVMIPVTSRLACLCI